MANRHLLEAGFEPSIDVRNWKDKGLDEKPQNKPMWRWQAEKRSEALIGYYQSKVESLKIRQQPIPERDNTPNFGF